MPTENTTENTTTPEALMLDFREMYARLAARGEPWRVAAHVRENVGAGSRMEHTEAAGELVSWLSYYMRELDSEQ
jgi:hypothetical protein